MTPKNILISWWTRWIWRWAVIQLLSEWHNIITFSRNIEKVNALIQDISDIYSDDRYIIMQGDATNKEDIQKIVDTSIQKFWTIDILINNAGCWYFASVDEWNMEKFQKMIHVNIYGLTLLTQIVVPYMKEKKKWLILNIASISWKKAFAYGEFYSATKFAVMWYSEWIRNELKEYGIKVSTLCPGMIKTDFFDEKEIARRMKIRNWKTPQMLEVEDINRIISLVCNQSDHCDIQDLTVMPF